MPSYAPFSTFFWNKEKSKDIKLKIFTAPKRIVPKPKATEMNKYINKTQAQDSTIFLAFLSFLGNQRDSKEQKEIIIIRIRIITRERATAAQAKLRRLLRKAWYSSESMGTLGGGSNEVAGAGGAGVGLGSSMGTLSSTTSFSAEGPEAETEEEEGGEEDS